MHMSPHLQAIRTSITNLVDQIEAARGDADADRDADQLSAWLERHPLVFAVASFGLELVGARLLARARGHRDDVPHVTWWNPPDSEGVVH
jgi:hypothetical protein